MFVIVNTKFSDDPLFLRLFMPLRRHRFANLFCYQTLEQIFDKNAEHHPYTVGLFGSIPDLASNKRRLEPIYGMTPDPSDLPSGCYFSPRCTKCREVCKQVHPEEHQLADGRLIKCHIFDEKVWESTHE